MTGRRAFLIGVACAATLPAAGVAIAADPVAGDDEPFATWAGRTTIRPLTGNGHDPEMSG